jgi:hypothetical protein
MWLFTTDGFYSAVTHREALDTIVVRARAREDVLRLIESVGEGSLVETPHSDYGFRVCLPRATWAAYAAAAADSVDYPDFKAAVAERQGSERAHAYGAVWAAMFAFQQRHGQRRS